MPYRLTDTAKWDDPWFIELKPNEKLLFNYLCDNCDTAGFYELSMKKFRASLHGLTDEEIKSALIGVEKCYVFSRKKDVIFLKNFCKHQKNAPLNLKNNAHVGIMARIDNYKSAFAFDIVKMINKDAKRGKYLANKGVMRAIGNGIFNIPFNDFWNLYGYKIGNKKECERKWDLLQYNIQSAIIEKLPYWKSNLPTGQSMPYPETFLNQERWNDELTIQNKKEVKSANGVTKNIQF